MMMDSEHAEPKADKSGYDAEEFRDFRVRYSDKIGSLAVAVHLLPKVDEEGRSDCPFAENLYAEKEEAAECAPEWVADLRDNYLPAIRREIEIEAQNLAVMESTVAEVGLEEAVTELDLGLGAQATRLSLLREEKEGMEEDLAWGEQILEESEEKKWPKGTPQKSVAAVPMPDPALAGDPLPFPPQLLLPQFIPMTDEELVAATSGNGALPEELPDDTPPPAVLKPQAVPEIVSPLPVAPPPPAPIGMGDLLAVGPIGPAVPPWGTMDPADDLDWLLGRGGLAGGPRL